MATNTTWDNSSLLGTGEAQTQIPPSQKPQVPYEAYRKFLSLASNPPSPPVQASNPPSPPVQAPNPPSPPVQASNPPSPPAQTAYQNIPYDLRRNGRWCVWKYEPRANSPKPAKVPYNPTTGQPASVADPSTFAPFDKAIQAVGNGYNGVGILVENEIAAIDIDNVINDQGSISPMAAEIINIMCCYTEISPSGRGIRILFLVKPGFVYDKPKYYINNQNIGLEIYVAGSTSKYVSVTGNICSKEVGLLERTQQLLSVMDKYMLRPSAAAPAAAIQPSAGQSQVPDDQIILNIRSSRSQALFDALFAGDMSIYNNDHSSADMAFCNILAAFTKDPDQIDRIFRSSKLMRPKWDSPRGQTTYGRMTIDKAIQSACLYALNTTQSVTVQQPQILQNLPISASELMKQSLPESTAYVDDMILEGTTTILAGAPKSGKSWLSLELAVSVTTSATFLGRSTTQASVLYLALEDSQKRLQTRLQKILAGQPAPDNLFLLTIAPSITDGLFAELDGLLAAYPNTKVIIVDTLAIVRDADKGGTFSYSNDYTDLRAFKRFSEARHIALILVHHVRKSRDDANPFNDISGTNGVTGAVDTMLVLDRKRNDSEATLHITGRDVTESSLAIALDKATMRWESLGDAEALRQEREKTAFLADPLVQTVRELVNTNPNHVWRGQAAELVAAGQANGLDLGVPQTVGYRLQSLSHSFEEYLGIRYDAAHANGNAGKTHTFVQHSSSLNLN